MESSSPSPPPTSPMPSPLPMESSSPPPPPTSPTPSPPPPPTSPMALVSESSPSSSVEEQGKLFVGGIPLETTESSLEEYFGKYGEVTGANVIRNRGTGTSRGFAFVRFADPAAAQRALAERDGHVILGKTVDIKTAIHRQYQDVNQGHNNNAGLNNNVSKKIFVGGLPPALTVEEFRSFFEKFGKITDVVVMHERETQRPRGFGFITFESEKAVETILQTGHFELNNKRVQVKIAVPKNSNNHNNYSSFDPSNGGLLSDCGERFVFDNRQGSLYTYLPSFVGWQGYAPQLFTGYGYGASGFVGGYPIGCYSGFGDNFLSANGRSPSNSFGSVLARQSMMPYWSTNLCPGCLNGGFGAYFGMLYAGCELIPEYSSDNEGCNQNVPNADSY